jgi:hypothetical protein
MCKKNRLFFEQSIIVYNISKTLPYKTNLVQVNDWVSKTSRVLWELVINSGQHLLLPSIGMDWRHSYYR